MDEWWNNINVWWRSGGIVGLGILAHLFIRVYILRTLERFSAATDNDLDDRLVHFFKKFYLLILCFVIFLMILRNHGIEITPLLASAGIVGIAIGLAAKETLADILAGIFLIADRPIRIGDRVKLERIGRHWGGWGDVVEIGLRRTQILNTDGVIVNYPNNLLANSIITNFSIKEAPVRLRVRFQVNYDADLKQVIQLTKDAIHSVDEVLEDTADVVIRSLWDDDGGHNLSGVLVEGRYLLDDVRQRTQVRSMVLRSIVSTFRDNNIAFAAPSLSLLDRA